MKKVTIKGKKYHLPQTLAEVTLSQWLRILKIELPEEPNLKYSKEENALLILLIQDYNAKILAELTSCPYAEIATSNWQSVETLLQDIKPLIEAMQYQPSTKNKPLQKFNFQNKEFHLFDFETKTLMQKKWFETYFKKTYTATAESIKADNLDNLPTLFAIIAWEKATLSKIINDTPIEINNQSWDNFSHLISEKAEAFKELPLNIAFAIMDFFLHSYKASGISTDTFLTTQTP